MESLRDLLRWFVFRRWTFLNQTRVSVVSSFLVGVVRLSTVVVGVCVWGGGRSVGLWAVSQVVAESSATASSLLPPITAPLDFSSTSGVLGGPAFGPESWMTSA